MNCACLLPVCCVEESIPFLFKAELFEEVKLRSNKITQEYHFPRVLVPPRRHVPPHPLLSRGRSVVGLRDRRGGGNGVAQLSCASMASTPKSCAGRLSPHPVAVGHGRVRPALIGEGGLQCGRLGGAFSTISAQTESSISFVFFCVIMSG